MTRSTQRSGCSVELTDRLRWYVHQASRTGSAHCAMLVLRPVESPEKSAVPGWAMSGLAARLRSHIRHGDAIETDGTRALVVILPGASLQGAHAVFMRVRELLSTTPAESDGVMVAAIGYASAARSALEADAVDTLLQAACQPRTLLTVSLTRPLSELTHSAPLATRSDHELLPEPERGVSRATLQLVRSIHTPDDVTTTLRDSARALGVPFVRLPARLPVNCRDMITVDLARELCAVAIGRSGNTLTVAMRDPRDAAAVLRLRAATGLAIFPVLADGDDLVRVIDELGEA